MSANKCNHKWERKYAMAAPTPVPVLECQLCGHVEREEEGLVYLNRMRGMLLGMERAGDENVALADALPDRSSSYDEWCARTEKEVRKNPLGAHILDRARDND